MKGESNSLEYMKNTSRITLMSNRVPVFVTILILLKIYMF